VAAANTGSSRGCRGTPARLVRLPPLLAHFNHADLGGRRPRLANKIEWWPPPRATETTAAAPRTSVAAQGTRGRCATQTGSRTARTRRPHPSQTQHMCGSRPNLKIMRTAAAAANASIRGGCRGTPKRLVRLPPMPPPCKHHDRGCRRPRLATMIQRRPPPKAKAAATAAARHIYCSRAVRTRPPHPSHNQHTCGSCPNLATLRTAAAAANTRNSGGCRGSPARHPRTARASAAGVPHAIHGRQPPPPCILNIRGGRRQHEQRRRLPYHADATVAQRMLGRVTRIYRRGGRARHASQAAVAAAPRKVARISSEAASRQEPDVGGGRHLTIATMSGLGPRASTAAGREQGNTRTLNSFRDVRKNNTSENAPTRTHTEKL